MLQPRTATAPLSLSLLLFGSGLCALVYQIAWLRLLRLVFGASTLASAAVLAIFMGGLGLGGWVLGRRADRHPSPLALYAYLELGIALVAALSPGLILLVRQGYVALGGTAQLGVLAGTSLRLLLSALVLGIPTFLMGGTLPAMARAAVQESDRGRRSVALLYGANTLGAVTGALLATFVSLELLGIRKSIWVAAALNLGIAVLAYALARRRAAPALTGPAESADSNPLSPRPRACPGGGRESPSVRTGFVLAAAAVVGFAFLLMELVWYRMLAPILGGSSYTFGLILAVALLGIGIGGLLYASGAGPRPTLFAFAGTCALEALFLVVPYALGDRVAVLTLLLRPLGDLGFGLLVVTWGAVAALVALPAAVVAGYQFPLLVAVLGAGRRRVGREVGLTYAWNTAGAILGSLAGGFGLIPWLSAPGAWRGVVVLLIALAGLAVALGWRQRRRTRTRPRPYLAAGLPLATGALGLVLCGAVGPTAFWRHSPIGAGRVPSSFNGPNELRQVISEQRRRVIWEVDGVESSVALDGQSQYIFLINGKADGSALRDAPNMVMSVLTGAALHPEPKRALVIGLGSGLSAGWLAQVPSMERVDVIEIEPAVLEVARRSSPVNYDVLSHPKVEVRIGDGRELLLTTDDTYDLIFSQPSNPYRAGISSLFSREFYAAAARRLNDGGLLLQWLQGYEVDGRLVSMAYATLGTVFPAVESWQVHETDLLLVAARREMVHDLPRIRSRLTQEPWRSALERVWGVAGLAGFYSGYLASPDFAAHLARTHGAAINTDDHPRMELGFVRSLGRAGLFHLAELGDLALGLGQARPRVKGGEVDWGAARELRSVRSVTWGGLPPADVAGAAAAAALGDEGLYQRVTARWAYRSGDLGQALAAWGAQSQAPESPLDRLLVAESLAESGHPQTPAWVALLRSRRPLEARAVLARWQARRGQRHEAARHLVTVFEACRDDPWIYPPILARSLELAQELTAADADLGGEIYAALDGPFAVLLVEELRLRTRLKIAQSLDRADLCLEALAPFEPHVPWERRFLIDRFRCYERSGHRLAETARQDTQRFLDHAPPRLEGGLLPEGSP